MDYIGAQQQQMKKKSQDHNLGAGKGNLQSWEDCLSKKPGHTRSTCKHTGGFLAPRLSPPFRAVNGLAGRASKVPENMLAAPVV